MLKIDTVRMLHDGFRIDIYYLGVNGIIQNKRLTLRSHEAKTLEKKITNGWNKEYVCVGGGCWCRMLYLR